jgi:hypothetical protein
MQLGEAAKTGGAKDHSQDWVGWLVGWSDGWLAGLRSFVPRICVDSDFGTSST